MKRKDFLADLRGKDVGVVRQQIGTFLDEMLKLRFRKAGQATVNASEVRKLRKNFARTLTVLGEKKGAQ